MEENKIIKNDIIDLRAVAKKIWDNRRAFIKPLAITFVIACIYIYSIPRYYVSEVKLAPEMENMMGNGTLSSIASTFGFNLNDMQSTDAITPLLYPDLMEDNGFIHSVMSVKVESQDSDISTNYHDYLQKYQSIPWWQYPINRVKSLLPMPEDKSGSKSDFDPYNITKTEDNIYNKARSDISVTIDKKTGVITINAKAQDPLISKTLCDSVKDKLQVFITHYRTNKSRVDLDYYQHLTDSAKRDYDRVRQKYASMSDAYSNVSLKSVTQKMEDLANDMNIKYSTYTTLYTQLQAAKAKVQEHTPAFTVIKGASVPTKPAGPKRMLFVIGMMFLVTFFTSCYIVIKSIKKSK